MAKPRSNTERRAKARAEGKCTICLKRKAAPNRKRCVQCIEYQKLARKVKGKIVY